MRINAWLLLAALLFVQLQTPMALAGQPESYTLVMHELTSEQLKKFKGTLNWGDPGDVSLYDPHSGVCNIYAALPKETGDIQAFWALGDAVSWCLYSTANNTTHLRRPLSARDLQLLQKACGTIRHDVLATDWAVQHPTVTPEYSARVVKLTPWWLQRPGQSHVA